MCNSCINCGSYPCELHHVVPLSLGGNDISSNKVPLCSRCHSIVHGFNPQKRGVEWKELQKAGIQKAKLEGKYKGRLKTELNKEEFIKEYKLWKMGIQNAKTTMEHLSLKPNTFYRRVKDYEEGREI